MIFLNQSIHADYSCMTCNKLAMVSVESEITFIMFRNNNDPQLDYKVISLKLLIDYFCRKRLQ